MYSPLNQQPTYGVMPAQNVVPQPMMPPAPVQVTPSKPNMFSQFMKMNEEMTPEEQEKREQMAKALLSSGAGKSMQGASTGAVAGNVLAQALQGYMAGGGTFGATPNAQNVVPGSYKG